MVAASEAAEKDKIPVIPRPAAGRGISLSLVSDQERFFAQNDNRRDFFCSALSRRSPGFRVLTHIRKETGAQSGGL